MSLLMALTDYYKLVDNIRQLEIQLTMVESSELGFVPSPGDEIE